MTVNIKKIRKPSWLLLIILILLTQSIVFHVKPIYANPTYEDFTSYTEVDPNNHITKTTNHIDFQAYRNEDAYLYADKGANHFGTSWEHKIDGKIVSSQNRAAGYIWMLTNDIDDWIGLSTAKATLALVLSRSSAGVYQIYLAETYLGSAYYSTLWTCSVNTPYYFTLKREGTAFTCKIYSDSARTNLLTTLSITLQAGQPSHRYIFAANTYNDNETYNNDLDIDNLDLQDPTIPTYGNIGTNTTFAGQPCLFHTKWTDDVGLSHYIFGSNNSGSWINDTAVAFTANPDWSNITKTLNNTIGVTVQWCIWANDTDNNWNNINTQSLTTIFYTYMVAANNGRYQPINHINYPCAEYYNGVTYLAYGGGTLPSSDLDIYITCYTHSTKTWATPIKIADAQELDGHCVPSMKVDNNGYIHVFTSSAHTNYPLKHYKSNSAENINVWTAQANIMEASGTYYWEYHKPVKEGNTMWLIFSQDPENVLYRDWWYKKSTDNGATWGSAIKIIEYGSSGGYNYGSYLGHVEKYGNKIHGMWCHRSDEQGANREDIFHAYLNTDDGLMYSMNGTNLGQSISLQEQFGYCLLVDTGTNITNSNSLHVDSNGYPWIIYYNGVETSGTFYHVRWTGSAWTTPTAITTTDSFGNMADFIIYSTTNVVAFVTTAGASGLGGDIEAWHWNGVVWSKQQTILTQATSGYPLMNPTVPINFNAEVMCVFCQLKLDYTTNLKLYAAAGIVETDSTPPTYSSISYSTTKAGQSCEFKSLWQDNIALSGYIFSWNGTDSWTNSTLQTLTGTSAWTSDIQTLPSTIGIVIGFRWYCKDSSNNWNATDIQTLTTTDPYAPGYSNIGYNTTNVEEPCKFSCYWHDEIGLAGFIFSTNITGTWQNETWVALSGTDDWANVTKTLPSTAGLVIGFRWYCNDTANNWGSTPIQTLIVTAPGYPMYSDVSHSSTLVASTCIFKTKITDGIALSGFIFSWRNGSNPWQNETWSDPWSGEPVWGWAETTKTLPNDLWTVSYMWYANDTTNHWTVSSSYSFTIVGYFFLFEFRDLEGNSVKATITWKLYNGTIDLNYVEGATTLTVGTYTLKTYFRNHLIQSFAGASTTSYGNQKITRDLNMKKLDASRYVALNQTVASITIQAATDENTTFTVDSSFGNFLMIVDVPRNCSYVKRDGLIQTEWTYATSPSNHVYVGIASLASYPTWQFYHPYYAGPTEIVWYMRNNLITVNGETGYSLNETNSASARYIDDFMGGSLTVYWGFRVWILHDSGATLLSSDIIAVMSRSIDGEGLTTSTWNCPGTSLIVGYDAVKITLYIRLGEGIWIAKASFITHNLMKKAISGTWQFQLYTKRIESGGETFGYAYWGTETYKSGIGNILLTEPSTQDIMLYELSRGNFVGAISYPYIALLGGLFYGFPLLIGGITLWLRYQNVYMILILAILLGGGGGFLSLMIPVPALGLGWILLALGLAVLFFKALW